MYTTQLLNQKGDITLAWTEEQAEMMTDVIERKMKEGYSFFIMADDGREVRLKKIADLAGRDRVIIGDKDAEDLIRQGRIGIVDVSIMLEHSDPVEAAPMPRAKTAGQAARSKTVATQPKAGG